MRNAAASDSIAETIGAPAAGSQTDGNILITYFSWGGNTDGIARQIQEKAGGDLFEIQLVTPLFQRLQHRTGRGAAGPEQRGKAGAE